jgi:hypothetical protein
MVNAFYFAQTWKRKCVKMQVAPLDRGFGWPGNHVKLYEEES